MEISLVFGGSGASAADLKDSLESALIVQIANPDIATTPSSLVGSPGTELEFAL